MDDFDGRFASRMLETAENVIPLIFYAFLGSFIWASYKSKDQRIGPWQWVGMLLRNTAVGVTAELFLRGEGMAEGRVFFYVASAAFLADATLYVVYRVVSSLADYFAENPWVLGRLALRRLFGRDLAGVEPGQDFPDEQQAILELMLDGEPLYAKEMIERDRTGKLNAGTIYFHLRNLERKDIIESDHGLAGRRVYRLKGGDP